MQIDRDGYWMQLVVGKAGGEVLVCNSVSHSKWLAFSHYGAGDGVGSPMAVNVSG